LLYGYALKVDKQQNAPLSLPLKRVYRLQPQIRRLTRSNNLPYSIHYFII